MSPPSRVRRPLSESPEASEAAALASAPRAAAEPPAGAVIADDDRLLTTGEMARLSSSTLRTVRFYEEEGILRPAKRTEGGHRLFQKRELDRLLFVSDLRTAGLSLEEIKEILALKKSSGSGEQAAKETRRIFGARIRELEEKLAVLTRLRDELTRTNEIVSACLTCRSNEHFPDACGVCSVMKSNGDLPRSTRVVWAVEASAAKPEVEDVSATDTDAPRCDGAEHDDGGRA